MVCSNVARNHILQRFDKEKPIFHAEEISRRAHLSTLVIAFDCKLILEIRSTFTWEIFCITINDDPGVVKSHFK